jgi:hypothetical protein
LDPKDPLVLPGRKVLQEHKGRRVLLGRKGHRV